MTPCPHCGSTTNAKFEKRNDWCGVCVHAVLDEQHDLDHEVVRHEVFDSARRNDG